MAGAHAWAGGAGETAFDLSLAIDLEVHDLTPTERQQMFAWNTVGSEMRMDRKLQIFVVMVKNDDGFELWSAAETKLYRVWLRRFKGEAEHELAWALPAETRRALQEAGSRSVGKASRRVELLNLEHQDYEELKTMYREEAKRGRTRAFLDALNDGLIKPLQAERIRYSECRNLALWRCAVLRREFLDNVGGKRLLAYHEKGLLGSNSGLTKQEVKRLAEAAARRVAEQSQPDAAQSPPPATASSLPLTRECETWPDGSAIVALTGGPWRGHICKFCADQQRWPGHHPSQCDRNPATAGWRTRTGAA